MKRKRKDFSVIPDDTSILLIPGAWVYFDEDTPLCPTWQQLEAWMISVRGAILSDGFGLEQDLILLELADEFGTVDHGTAPRAFFERDQELRLEKDTLKKKIDRVKPIIRRLREPASADKLIHALSDCRVARNLMAHQACWLEPVNDDQRRRTVALKLFIADRHHVWELEEDDVTRWRKLFLEVRRELICLRLELTGTPAPTFANGSTAIAPPI